MTDGPSERDAAIRGVCEAFQKAWHSGRRPSLAAILEEHADLDRLVLLRALIPIEVDFRRQAGEFPTPEEYRAAFPELGDGVEALFVSSQTLTIASGTLPPDRRRAAPFPIGALGDYDLLEELGRGGMGVVYKARQRRLDRIVAIKTTHSGDLIDGEELQRFKTETEAIARLEHQNIVPIHDVGEFEGRHFFSMGYVDGPSLSEVLRDGPLEPRRALEIGRAVADAVAYSHEQGIVHRDLKPGNILIDKEGRPRVTDFGLAKRIDAPSGMTATSQTLGTPSFMPPEQALGRSVGMAVDVYSLGALLYNLVTGRPPFQAATSVETLRQVVEVEPVAPRRLNPAVGRDFETVLLRCLEKDPAKRYPSMQTLGDELERVLAGEPILARPVGLAGRLARWCRRRPALAATSIAAALAVIACLVVLAIAVFRIRSARDDALEIASRNGHLLKVFQLERETLEEASRREIDAARQRQVTTLCQVALASQSGDSNRELDNATTTRLRTIMSGAIEEHPETVTAALSRKTDRLATGESSGTVRVWNVETGAEVDRATFGDRVVRRLSFEPDDATVLVVMDDGKEHRWVPDWSTGDDVKSR